MRKVHRQPRGARSPLVAGFGLFLLAAAASGEQRVVHALLDPDGLPALHNTIEDGEPKMWLPQFRLFDAEGRPLWSFHLMTAKRDFRRELADRLERREVLPAERSLQQEARHLLRRGGLPINLTALPPAELTVIEYWTDDCGQCRDLSREVDRYFDRAADLSVRIIRVFIPLDVG